MTNFGIGKVKQDFTMTLSVSNHEIHVNTIKFTNHFVLIQASYKTKNIQIVVSLIFQKFQLRSSDG